ncbi:hypothetical protein MNV49_005845 [Pseudohyphozyma bogoriensis]|nr:hypothetical protein MNV49_005845 [Pseudohyphozyma bogoriensis]
MTAPKLSTTGTSSTTGLPSSKSPALEFEVVAKCSTTKARVSRMRLPHGETMLPTFMPVATQATMKGLTASQLHATKPPLTLLLNNTYHLSLRPGPELLEEAGGAHKFQGWKGNMLTDSGGFQMVSLAKLSKVLEEGVLFANPYNNEDMTLLTPERSMQLQHSIGSDIMMQLDDVVSSLTVGERMEEAMWRSVRWLDRCLAYHTPSPNSTYQNLFAIIQGGLDPELRDKCLDEMLKPEREAQLPGYAVGGLSGGEEKEVFWRIVKQCADRLPEGKPRYTMGVGYSEDLLVCVALGIDMHDCVFPTRTARFGVALTFDGPLNLKHASNRHEFCVIDDECECPTCEKGEGLSRSYLWGLSGRETVGANAVSLHNVAYQSTLMHRARQAILEDRYPQYLIDFFARYFKQKELYPSSATLEPAEVEGPTAAFSPPKDVNERDVEAGAGGTEKAVELSLEDKFPMIKKSKPAQALFMAAVVVGQGMTQGQFGAAMLGTTSSIGEWLGTSDPGEWSWMPGAYGLTLGIFVIFFGPLGDKYGSKNILLMGYLIMIAGNIGSGFCTSPIPFDVCRAIAGIGGAAVVPNANGLIGKSFPPGTMKNIGFAVLGALAPAGALIGGLLSSLMIETIGPRWIYWVTACIAAAVATLAFVVIPNDTHFSKSPIDFIGFWLLGGGLILFNFAWNQGPLAGWTTPHVPALMGTGIVMAGLYYLWSLHLGDRAIVPPVILTRETLLVLLALMFGWASFGTFLFYTPQFIANIRGVSKPLAVSAEMVPLAPGGIAAALLTIVLFPRVPGHVIFAIALAAFTVGNLFMAVTPPEQNYWYMIFWACLLVVWGPDLSFASGSLIVSNGSPHHLQGSAGGLVAAITNYSVSIGLVLICAELYPRLTSASLTGLGMAGTVETYVSNGDTLRGYRGAFYFSTCIAFVGCLVVALECNVKTLMGKGMMSTTATREPDAARDDEEKDQPSRSKTVHPTTWTHSQYKTIVAAFATLVFAGFLVATLVLSRHPHLTPVGHYPFSYNLYFVTIGGNLAGAVCGWVVAQWTTQQLRRGTLTVDNYADATYYARHAIRFGSSFFISVILFFSINQVSTATNGAFGTTPARTRFEYNLTLYDIGPLIPFTANNLTSGFGAAPADFETGLTDLATDIGYQSNPMILNRAYPNVTRIDHVLLPFGIGVNMYRPANAMFYFDNKRFQGGEGFITLLNASYQSSRASFVAPAVVSKSQCFNSTGTVALSTPGDNATPNTWTLSGRCPSSTIQNARGDNSTILVVPQVCSSTISANLSDWPVIWTSYFRLDPSGTITSPLFDCQTTLFVTTAQVKYNPAYSMASVIPAPSTQVASASTHVLFSDVVNEGWIQRIGPHGVDSLRLIDSGLYRTSELQRLSAFTRITDAIFGIAGTKMFSFTDATLASYNSSLNVPNSTFDTTLIFDTPVLRIGSTSDTSLDCVIFGICFLLCLTSFYYQLTQPHWKFDPLDLPSVLLSAQNSPITSELDGACAGKMRHASKRCNVEATVGYGVLEGKVGGYEHLGFSWGKAVMEPEVGKKYA